jgi:hypothetical protein
VRVVEHQGGIKTASLILTNVFPLYNCCWIDAGCMFIDGLVADGVL